MFMHLLKKTPGLQIGKLASSLAAAVTPRKDTNVRLPAGGPCFALGGLIGALGGWGDGGRVGGFPERGGEGGGALPTRRTVLGRRGSWWAGQALAQPQSSGSRSGNMYAKSASKL